MNILPPHDIIDATQPAVMEPSILYAAHTDALHVQNPKDYQQHRTSASGGDRLARTAAEEDRRSRSHSPADSHHSPKRHSLEQQSEQMLLPSISAQPAAHPASLTGSTVNIKHVEAADAPPYAFPPAAPKLPAPVVISLPICLEHGIPVETQSFPLSNPLTQQAVPPVMRLVPGVLSHDEDSDCNTIVNPWFVPTPGFIRKSLYGTHTRPSKPFTTRFPADGRKDTVMAHSAAETLPPDVSGDARGAQGPQEDKQNVPEDTPATVASGEVIATTTSDLNGTSPDTISTVEEVATPLEGMPAQTWSQAPQSKNPEPAGNNVLAPGLYGRERNQKRAATKAYRQPITPRALRSANSKKAATSASSATVVTTCKAKRAAPGAEGPKEKRPRLFGTAASTRSRRVTHPVDADARRPQEAEEKPGQPGTSPRPVRDTEEDRQYVAQLQEVLEIRSKARKADMGQRQAARINDLLDLASYPSKEEALFLTTEEATGTVARGKFFNGPIITEGQQALPLQTVSDFCDEYYDDDTMVWIQDPEIRPSMKAQIARQVKMGQVKERLAGPESNKPWNCLELATHSDDGLKPSFLNTEDCRLLTKLKIPDPQDKPEARRRAYLPGYKEVEKWALLAQAGALTEPHQDSHGYSTYITINQGQVGFGWLSSPTDEERAAWRRNPNIFRGGKWRYIILKPGQTVYFPAGTVHFVFRLPSAGNSLAFGGHVLRCSNLVHWVKTLIEERDAKNVTNEDLTESAPGYLAKVEKFVLRARITGQEAKWGGEEAIKEFLKLKEEFLKKKQKK